jgi:hypothetical protein
VDAVAAAQKRAVDIEEIRALLVPLEIFPDEYMAFSCI